MSFREVISRLRELIWLVWVPTMREIASMFGFRPFWRFWLLLGFWLLFGMLLLRM